MNLREAAQQALEALERADKISGHGNNRKTIVALRSALAEDVPETNFGNMAQVVDCYGDGNVYRGQRSRDSKTPTITVSTLEKVDPVAYVTGFSKGYAVVQPVNRSLLMPVGMALYRSPPTSQESRQVEPVAYVKGYSKGRCIIEAVDPDWLLPVGMALYRLPPANQNYLNGYCVGRTDLLAEQAKAETVEPVAWRFYDGKIWCYVNHISDLSASTKFEPLYPAPPKRKPLTKEQLLYVYNQLPNWGMDMDSISQDLVAFARAIERAHGIGGEE